MANCWCREVPDVRKRVKLALDQRAERGLMTMRLLLLLHSPAAEADVVAAAGGTYLAASGQR